jgi:hypothetical protein
MPQLLSTYHAGVLLLLLFRQSLPFRREHLRCVTPNDFLVGTILFRKRFLDYIGFTLRVDVAEAFRLRPCDVG